MPNIQQLVDCPELSIQKEFICQQEFPAIDAVYILEPDQPDLETHAIYIGSANDMLPLLSRSILTDPFLFLCTDADENQWLELIGHAINIFLISETAVKIMNALNKRLALLRRWQRTFSEASLTGASAALLIRFGSEMLDSPLFLLAPNGSVIASCCSFGSPGREILPKDALPGHRLIKILENKALRCIPIRYGATVLAYAVIHTEAIASREYLLEPLLNTLKGFFKSQYPTHLPAYQISFDQLIHDLLNQVPLTQEETEKRLAEMELHLHRPFICMVTRPLHPADDPLSILPIADSIRQLYPSSYSSLFNEQIISLIPSSDYTSEPTDNPLLIEILHHQHAIAGISPPGNHLQILHTYYLMATAALTFGPEFSTSPVPVYHYEDYRYYHMIDMCHETFLSRYGHNNLIYLCHPYIIHLYYHDSENGTDYLHILHTYLSLDCSLAQSARRLNYHRNTMLYKINKIEEILETSLNDSHLKQTLIFSCMTLKYISQYHGQEISRSHTPQIP